MADRVEVDPDALDEASLKTRGVSGAIKTIVKNLGDGLGGLETPDGLPWGSDDMGKKFVAGKNNDGYGPSKTMLFDGLKAFTDTLDAYADGQAEGAELLRTQEIGNVGSFGSRPRTVPSGDE